MTIRNQIFFEVNRNDVFLNGDLRIIIDRNGARIAAIAHHNITANRFNLGIKNQF